MSSKATTYIRYFKDYIKHEEYGFIWTSICYELFGRPQKTSSEYTSSLGKFFTRSGTIDFKFANYAYEWDVKKFFLSHYQDYTVFLDIGANIGVYSILMAQKGLSCHAFEPMPDNYQALLKNISLNKLEDFIRTYNIALGNEESDCEFIYEKINTGASRIATSVSDYNGPKNSSVTVTSKVSTLDRISRKLDLDPDEKILVKMDAEGMELMILQGALEFFTTHHHILLIIEKKYQSINAISELLGRTGKYECLEVDEYNIAYRKL